MRSACWGARSVRSLITMRPLVVSITIAFALSRLAGSGWAIAGAATEQRGDECENSDHENSGHVKAGKRGVA